VVISPNGLNAPPAFLHLPPAMGMMMGLSYLMIASFLIAKFRNIECDIFKKLANTNIY
jgi:hypothetical protein